VWVWPVGGDTHADEYATRRPAGCSVEAAWVCNCLTIYGHLDTRCCYIGVHGLTLLRQRVAWVNLLPCSTSSLSCWSCRVPAVGCNHWHRDCRRDVVKHVCRGVTSCHYLISPTHTIISWLVIIIIIVIIIIQMPMLIVLSSWQSHYVHLMNVERRQAGADPQAKRRCLGLLPVRVGSV